jgi:AmpE protein
MATSLLAILVALIVGHTVPDLSRVRDYAWFTRWIAALERNFAASGFWRSAAGLLLTVALPVALIGALQLALHGRLFGFASFVLGTIALFYAWGPRDLDLDVETLAGASDAEARRSALATLGGGVVREYQPDALVDATFRAALSRWFGPLVWFLLLGPAGAIGFRLLQIAARDPRTRDALPPAQQSAAEAIARALEWPAAQLMVLALAVASDFDEVAQGWRDWHAQPGPIAAFDVGFLSAAAQSTVDLDDTDDEPAIETYPEPARGPHAALGQSLALVWRVLVVWLAVLALMVLAGFIA